MTAEALEQMTSPTEQSPPEVPEWEPPMPPTDLIFDDGEPLETNRHRVAMNALIRSLKQAWSDRNDFFTGGNMFIYYSSVQAKNRDFRGPDFFTVLNTQKNDWRDGWVVWEENGRYPDVIVELMSNSTAHIDKGVKKQLYEQVFRTPDYFVYHPFDPNSLQGWHLVSGQGYQPLIPNDRGWLWSQTLGLWLGNWEGSVEGVPGIWLRFYDSEGNLVLLPEEAAEQKASQAEQKASQAEQNASQAEQKASQAEQKASQAEQKASQAEQKASQAEQKAQRLAERLKALGVDPEML